jgi:uncharacterized protein (DUF2267 family)
VHRRAQALAWLKVKEKTAMDELIKLVAQKAGITTEQAKTAVTTVMGFLKDKLPAPIAGQLEAALSGKMPDLGQGLGGMLGKK